MNQRSLLAQLGKASCAAQTKAILGSVYLSTKACIKIQWFEFWRIIQISLRWSSLDRIEVYSRALTQDKAGGESSRL